MGRIKKLPGDVLKLETEIIKKSFFCIGKAIATVNGYVVSKAELLFVLEKN